MVENTYCFCAGPELGSQHPYQTALQLLVTQAPVGPSTLFDLRGSLHSLLIYRRD